MSEQWFILGAIIFSFLSSYLIYGKFCQLSFPIPQTIDENCNYYQEQKFAYLRGNQLITIVPFIAIAIFCLLSVIYCRLQPTHIFMSSSLQCFAYILCIAALLCVVAIHKILRINIPLLAICLCSCLIHGHKHYDRPIIIALTIILLVPITIVYANLGRIFVMFALRQHFKAKGFDFILGKQFPDSGNSLYHLFYRLWARMLTRLSLLIVPLIIIITIFNQLFYDMQASQSIVFFVIRLAPLLLLLMPINCLDLIFHYNLYQHLDHDWDFASIKANSSCEYSFPKSLHVITMGALFFLVVSIRIIATAPTNSQFSTSILLACQIGEFIFLGMLLCEILKWSKQKIIYHLAIKSCILKRNLHSELLAAKHTLITPLTYSPVQLQQFKQNLGLQTKAQINPRCLDLLAAWAVNYQKEQWAVPHFFIAMALQQSAQADSELDSLCLRYYNNAINGYLLPKMQTIARTNIAILKSKKQGI